jgi:hypothetical protein
MRTRGSLEAVNHVSIPSLTICSGSTKRSRFRHCSRPSTQGRRRDLAGDFLKWRSRIVA